MAMTKTQKGALIDELQEVLDNTPTLYITDIAGLDSAKTTELRRSCYKNEITLRVVKNTLLRKAMERANKDYDDLYDTLKGNTAIMISEKGNAPAKLIDTFRKKSEKPVLKGAWIEEAIYIGDEQVKTLKDLKSKEDLVADVVALLQSPVKTVIGQLQSGGQKISGIVKTLSEKEQ